MASGVSRPYSVTDVIGSLQDGITGANAADTSITGVGFFAEADETLGLIDSATVTQQANAPWGSGTWGAVIWG